MKKHLLVLAAFSGMVLGASIAQAGPETSKGMSTGKGIVGSVHDMGATAQAVGDIKDKDGRICAYCHTPHHAETQSSYAAVEIMNLDAGSAQYAYDNPGATQAEIDAAASGLNVKYNVYAPLWSRQDLTKASGYAPYKSATFNPAMDGKPYDPLIGPSRLCLTCHDGKIAIDSYYGQTGTATNLGGDAMNMFGSGEFAIASGAKGLSNDHPIGMKYTDYLGFTNADGVAYELMPVDTKFVRDDGKAAQAKSVKNVLFTDPQTPGISDFVTCASCHDVHNGKAVGNTAPTSDRGYLLYGKQADSSFCLTCHDKNNGIVP